MNPEYDYLFKLLVRRRKTGTGTTCDTRRARADIADVRTSRATTSTIESSAKDDVEICGER